MHTWIFLCEKKQKRTNKQTDMHDTTAIVEKDVSPCFSVCFEGVPLVEFICLVFTHMPGESYERRFRSLLLCLLSVERYYFPLIDVSYFVFVFPHIGGCGD